MKQIKKILVSQPRPLSTRNPYTDMEAEYGLQCDFQQLIKIEGLGVREFRDQHVYLEEYTAVIVNSRLGIDHYFRLAEETRFSVPESMHYYCISEAVGNYLQKYIQYLLEGNYNEKTAAIYTDLSLLTMDQSIGRDANEFFKNMMMRFLK